VEVLMSECDEFKNSVTILEVSSNSFYTPCTPGAVPNLPEFKVGPEFPSFVGELNSETNSTSEQSARALLNNGFTGIKECNS
jgi:hypothetical protein